MLIRQKCGRKSTSISCKNQGCTLRSLAAAAKENHKVTMSLWFTTANETGKSQGVARRTMNDELRMTNTTIAILIRHSSFVILNI
jgi:hypothetical protein